MASVIQLKYRCNNYAWGKIGRDSLAAHYATATPGTEFKIDETVEYAEMWMGTYPTTPSSVFLSGEDLQVHINANKEKLIGKAILSKFGPDLPFLPSKDLAAQLHKKDPEKFSDSNHKPEIAVALGRFECFVGFIPLLEIEALFTSVPALARFISVQKAKFDNETLREIDLERTPIFKFGKNLYIPALLVTKLEAGETETILALRGPGIMAVTSGTGTLKAEGKQYALKEGHVFFIGFNTELELVAVDKTETYIAYCEA